MPLASALSGFNKAAPCNGRPKSRGHPKTLGPRHTPASAASDSDHPDEPWLPPLDVPPVLPPSLATLRQRLASRVGRELQLYDEGAPRPEAEEHETRRTYDLHLRHRASVSVRRRLEGVLARGRLQSSRPRIVLICLLPVHIVTEERFRVLLQTLRSIRQQEVPSEEVEVILSVSWYADAVFVDRVRGALLELSQAPAVCNALCTPTFVPVSQVLSHREWHTSESLARRSSWGARRQASTPWHRPKYERSVRCGISTHSEDAPELSQAHEVRWRETEQRRRSISSVQLFPEPASYISRYTIRVAIFPAQHDRDPRPPNSCFETALTQQSQRRSQFQHLGFALTAAEAQLRDRWASEAADADKRSIWVMFGDDDDLWHPRRIATFIHTMQSHPSLDSVGIFATFARANVEGNELAAGELMPTSVLEVDNFLVDGRATLNSEEADASSWLETWNKAGEGRAELLMPDGLNLEYFDFCPRLRILREFFDVTAPELLAHRFCDLRLDEFLIRYTLKGKEFGLELSFVESESWLYFYAHKGVQDGEWDVACEGTDDWEACLPRPVGVSDGHVSSNVTVDSADVHLARNRWRDFLQFDGSMTPAKLSRYLAHFRFNMEMMMIRHHRQEIDQPEFSTFVLEGAQNSFLGFLQTLREAYDLAGEDLMLSIASGIAKSVAKRFQVSILWQDEDNFISPADFHRPSSMPGSDTEQCSSCSDDERPGVLSSPRSCAMPNKNPHHGEVRSEQDECGELAALIRNVREKALRTWSMHGEINDMIRSFTLQAECGKANHLTYREVLDLLEVVGIPSSNILQAMDFDMGTLDECEARDIALCYLPKLFPDSINGNRLHLRGLYRLFEALGISVSYLLKTLELQLGECDIDVTSKPLLHGFKLIHMIGKGMRSSVLLCENTKTSKRAALKWPMAEKELRVMMKLQQRLAGYSYIPRVEAHGRLEEELYVVTQLLGSDLQRLFFRFDDRPFEVRWALVCLIGRMVLRRLEAVHRCGFVHCDVSPYNIVLGHARGMAGVVPYLIDLGCAQEFPGGEPVGGDHGSMEFASVRCAQTCERRPEDDLEALGWTMAHGLFGEPPWNAWLQEFYGLKPALQRIKRQKVLERVCEAKRSVLANGWNSLDCEGTRTGEMMPEQWDQYMHSCQKLDSRTHRPDYRGLACLLGGKADLDHEEAELEDVQQLLVVLTPELDVEIM
mmetsp:Transcript_32005/g.91866  ORF Transcript_32005/g.91866 Transcript_32005/m.91866 type:complete len:1197 (+) Transcript_32005:140-3730(+)